MCPYFCAACFKVETLSFLGLAAFSVKLKLLAMLRGDTASLFSNCGLYIIPEEGDLWTIDVSA